MSTRVIDGETIRTAHPQEIDALNEQARGIQRRAALCPLDAVNRLINTSDMVELVADETAAVYLLPNGDLVNVWFDAGTGEIEEGGIGFDDQIEWAEDRLPEALRAVQIIPAALQLSSPDLYERYFAGESVETQAERFETVADLRDYVAYQIREHYPEDAECISEIVGRLEFHLTMNTGRVLKPAPAIAPQQVSVTTLRGANGGFGEYDWAESVPATDDYGDPCETLEAYERTMDAAGWEWERTDALSGRIHNEQGQVYRVQESPQDRDPETGEPFYSYRMAWVETPAAA